jgi:RNA polymerase sigma-70 factor (ECF subfamily)
MDATSATLIDRVRRGGDDAAWRRLDGVYRPLLADWLRKHRLDAADCDDLVQDVLVVVLQELPAFEHNGRPGAFRAWLRQVMVNRLRRHWRTRTPAVGADATLAALADPDSDLSRDFAEEHDRHVLARLLELVEGDFEPNTWQAFRRTVLDGRPPAEVAAELDMRVNTVLHAKSRVLRRLRQEKAMFLG